MWRHSRGVDSADTRARAVFVVDKEGKIAHLEYVREVGEEPNYEEAINKATELLS